MAEAFQYTREFSYCTMQQCSALQHEQAEELYTAKTKIAQGPPKTLRSSTEHELDGSGVNIGERGAGAGAGAGAGYTPSL